MQAVAKQMELTWWPLWISASKLNLEHPPAHAPSHNCFNKMWKLSAFFSPSESEPAQVSARAQGERACTSRPDPQPTAQAEEMSVQTLHSQPPHPLLASLVWIAQIAGLVKRGWHLELWRVVLRHLGSSWQSAKR